VKAVEDLPQSLRAQLEALRPFLERQGWVVCRTDRSPRQYRLRYRRPRDADGKRCYASLELGGRAVAVAVCELINEWRLARCRTVERELVARILKREEAARQG